MATKSQLKTYFEKGDIPTSTQFGELIDSLLSVPSEDTMDRPNQNLFFGNARACRKWFFVVKYRHRHV